MHPFKPPLPADKNRPVQFDGSHASMLKPERSEVETERAMRQMSAVTSMKVWPHVELFVARLRLVPAATNSAKWTTAFSIASRDAMVAQFELKSSGVVLLPAHPVGSAFARTEDALSSAAHTDCWNLILAPFAMGW